FVSGSDKTRSLIIAPDLKSDDIYETTNQYLSAINSLCLSRNIPLDLRVLLVLDKEVEPNQTPAFSKQYAFQLEVMYGLRTPSSLLDALYNLTVSEQKSPTTSPSLRTTAHTHFSSAKVLLVEDNTINMDVGSALLTELGITPDCAKNGQIALDMASNIQYDLILMDVQMPVLGGLEACRQLRLIPNYKHTPIIALTANAMHQDKQQCLEAGMSAHLSKPIDPQELEKTLALWLVNDHEKQPITDVDAPNMLTDLLPQDFPGLDIARGLRMSSGDSELYLKLLSRFESSNIDTFNTMQNLASTQAYQTLVHEAHKLKGVAATLGMRKLAAVADHIEHQTRQGIAVDAKALEKLNDRLEQAINNVRRILKLKAQTHMGEPKVSAMSSANFRTQLILLKQRIEESDTEAQDIAQSLLNSAPEPHIRQRLSQIQELLYGFDFEDAHPHICQLIDMWPQES
ncbi:MAG: Hpt domain-containing response regulator, partial [Pontibacterium sp.]